MQFTFEEAAELVREGCVPQATKEQQLRLYGLFKVVNRLAPPAPIQEMCDVVTRAKIAEWNAQWKECQGDPEIAQNKYILMVQEMLPS